MTYEATLLEQAHRASMRNRDAVLESDLCACFACLATFEPCAVRHWTDHDAKGVPQTPFCPSCGMDAVLAKASGFSLDREFLLAMHEHFCTNPDEEPDSSPAHAAFASLDEAYALLERLGAAPWLLRHVELVGEALDVLLRGLKTYDLPIDPGWIRVGVAFHDAGKILHPSEMSRSGDLHEASGERLLLAQGVSPTLARVCLSHARWDRMEVSLSELLVALADKLWKGKRHSELEQRVVESVAEHTRRDAWDLFVELDSLFERIAGTAEGRLRRSNVSKV